MFLIGGGAIRSRNDNVVDYKYECPEFLLLPDWLWRVFHPSSISSHGLVHLARHEHTTVAIYRHLTSTYNLTAAGFFPRLALRATRGQHCDVPLEGRERIIGTPRTLCYLHLNQGMSWTTPFLVFQTSNVSLSYARPRDKLKAKKRLVRQCVLPVTITSTDNYIDTSPYP